jgi:hypothetical protein
MHIHINMYIQTCTHAHIHNSTQERHQEQLSRTVFLEEENRKAKTTLTQQLERNSELEAKNRRLRDAVEKQREFTRTVTEENCNNKASLVQLQRRVAALEEELAEGKRQLEQTAAVQINAKTLEGIRVAALDLTQLEEMRNAAQDLGMYACTYVLMYEFMV